MFQALINIDKEVINGIALVRECSWPFLHAFPHSHASMVIPGMRNTLIVSDQKETAEIVMEAMSNQINALYGIGMTKYIERPMIGRLHTQNFGVWDAAMRTGCIETSVVSKTALSISQGFPVVDQGNGVATQAHVILDMHGDFDQRYALSRIKPELSVLTTDRIGMTMFAPSSIITEEIRSMFDVVWDLSYMTGTATDPYIMGKLERSIYGSEGLQMPMFLKNWDEEMPVVKADQLSVKPSEEVRRLIRLYEVYLGQALTPNPFEDVCFHLTGVLDDLRRLRKTKQRSRAYGRAIKILQDFHGTVNYKNWRLE